MKTALVTGASKGIGREIARQLAARGVRVFASGRDAEDLRSLAAETGCLAQSFDLADAKAPQDLYAAAKAAFGAGPDFLVNNAGFNRRKSPAAEITAAELDESYAVLLRAGILLCGAAMRDMVPRKSGHIVNVLSSAAWNQPAGSGTYAAMKCAFHGFTHSLIKEARPHGVKVTGVYPGGVDTPFRANARPDYLSAASTAHMIVDTLFAPADVFVHQLTFRPQVDENF